MERTYGVSATLASLFLEREAIFEMLLLIALLNRTLFRIPLAAGEHLPFCLQKVLFSLGGSFLYYADRFKIYSAFCASHTKVPKVLVKGNLCIISLLQSMCP